MTQDEENRSFGLTLLERYPNDPEIEKIANSLLSRKPLGRRPGYTLGPRDYARELRWWDEVFTLVERGRSESTAIRSIYLRHNPTEDPERLPTEDMIRRAWHGRDTPFRDILGKTGRWAKRAIARKRLCRA